jgi:NAD(P)-dependent dehydrogenase (short-subunit alcohol dehydrogenase family)
MREHGSGTIVNISSIGARSCPLGSGHYAATKAALEALSGSLTKEVGPLGLRVMIVEPGGFRTNYKNGLDHVHQPIDAYADTVGARRERDKTEHDLQRGDPARAAQAILTAVRSPAPPHLLVLGPDALGWFRGSVKELSADVDAWEHVGATTDFTD